MSNTYIIIPTCRPAPGFPELVSEICDRGYRLIVVHDWDDRHKRTYTQHALFDSLDPRAIILHQDRILGKGVAIRTGLAYIRDHFLREDEPTEGDLVAVMGANGMYTPEDLDHLLAAARRPENRGKLTLGVRVFTGKSPLLSRIGNGITRTIFHMLVHVHVSDTMTGLRACATSYIPALLDIEGDRSEYEMNQLTYFARRHLGFCEVPVRRDRPGSLDNYHLIRDSLRIYLGMFKFATSSFTSFLVDFAFFCLFSWLLADHFPGIGDLMANLAARLISATLNYFLNCRYVFKRKPDWKSAAQFAALAVAIILVNSGVLYLWKLTPLPRPFCKLFTEICMFFVNYVVQHKVIFKKRKNNR